MSFLKETGDSPEEAMSLWNRHFFALALLALGILFVNLHVGDLSGYDDAFHAAQARAMLDTGDWLTVRHNGYHNPGFPPLYYWMQAASMKFLGANDFAAKFPSAVLGWGTIVAIYFIAFELTGKIWFALTSMAILATTQYFLKYSTHAMTDVPLAFFIALAALFYIKGFKRPRFFLLSGLAVGLGLLTRPFVGVISPAIFLTHLLWIRRFDLLRSRYILAGVGLAALFPLLWYGTQYRLYGLQSMLGPTTLLSHQLSYSKTPQLRKILRELLPGYPWLLLKVYWPWLPFAVTGLVMCARKVVRERESSSALLLSWVAWILLPYSLGSIKLLRYILPVFPAFAVLAAMPIHHWLPAKRREACFRGLWILGLAAILFMFFSPGNLMRATDMRTIGPVACAHSIPGQRLILYTSGSLQWNYQNQLIWYAHRNTEFPTTLDDVLMLMKKDPGAPVVMDRDSFPLFQLKTGTVFVLKILGESRGFLCFRAVS
jgi:4-amino-4-deoxy-L-arabinose transferase-like glycosyltransferase